MILLDIFDAPKKILRAKKYFRAFDARFAPRRSVARFPTKPIQRKQNVKHFRDGDALTIRAVADGATQPKQRQFIGRRRFDLAAWRFEAVIFAAKIKQGFAIRPFEKFHVAQK